MSMTTLRHLAVICLAILAIEATRNIRFFPAIKDGKAVAQRIQLEYNFSLF